MAVNPTSKMERQFIYTMNRLLRSMQRAVSAAKTPGEAIRLLNLYSQSKEYKEWCEKIAAKITTQVNTAVNGTWREAAARAGRGSKIYENIMREIKSPLGGFGCFWTKIRENSELIKTFPSDISVHLNRYIAEEGLKGWRSEDILVDLMKKFPNTAKSRLKLIARTEVSKTQTAFTQARATALGANWYIWRTSEDERVRGSHNKMNGVLVNWKDPPSPETLAGMKSYGKYHAGDIFNCRCYPDPIVNFDYVEFPAKVYYNGAIRTMSRKQFEKIAA